MTHNTKVRRPMGGDALEIASGGQLLSLGQILLAQGAPAAKTVTAAITAAEWAGQLITTTGATAPSIHQLPTGTLLAAQFPNIAAGHSFDFSLVNTGTAGPDDATITVNTGITIVGNPTVSSVSGGGGGRVGSGHFRARYSAANTFVVYRMA